MPASLRTVGARQLQFWRFNLIGWVLSETLLCGWFLCCLGCRIGVVVCIVQRLFNVILRICRFQSTTLIFNWMWTRVQCPCRPQRSSWRGSQEQRQAQHEGFDVDVDVEVDWEVPEVPEPADFRDDLHSPDKFLKVTCAEATAVDVIDGGGTRIRRLFQAQVIRRGSGPNRVVECPVWAVLQGKAGVQPWVV